MKNIKLLKPQPSPKNGREPLANITNCFHSRPKSQKETHRSPSHSPCSSSRITHIQTKRVLTPKAPLQAKFMHLPIRCINHREKQGKFRAEGDPGSCHYCENCAVELSQKGKRLLPVKNDPPTSKMVTEAKKYLRSLEEILEKITQKKSQTRVEKYKLDSRYNGIHEDIEQQRRNIISKINDQYDCQIHKLAQERGRQMAKIEQQEERLKKMENDLMTVREDVSGNLNEINIHIDQLEFREIMTIYWDKIAHAQERLNKETIMTHQNIVDSTQAFVSKYIPSDNSQRGIFQQNIKKMKPSTPTGKEFTFSKKFAAPKCKETFSWECSNPDSVESIVQEKIKIK